MDIGKCNFSKVFWIIIKCIVIIYDVSGEKDVAPKLYIITLFCKGNCNESNSMLIDLSMDECVMRVLFSSLPIPMEP